MANNCFLAKANKTNLSFKTTLCLQASAIRKEFSASNKMGINEQNEITRGRETIVGWMLIFQSEVLIVINERTVDIRQQIYYFHNLASKRW